VHHVSDRRQLDQQNLIEVVTREIGRRQDQNYSLSEGVSTRTATPSSARHCLFRNLQVN
jgi:hypothetical protein